MRLPVFAAIASFAVASSAFAGDTKDMKKDDKDCAMPQSKSNTLFDKLKPLVGTWTAKMGGKDVVVAETKLTANGTVLVETMMPGTPHEMVNTYALDGDKLVMTHYCAMGNQPRMEATAEKSPGVIAFKLRDATNVDVKTGDYMGGLTLAMKDADHLTQDWQSFEKGQPAKQVEHFELTRKK